MKIPEINTVCFIGAGSMGCYNSLLAALAGYRVALYDISQETLDQVDARQRQFGDSIVVAGLCLQQHIDQALTLVTLHSELESIADSIDLVSESITEQLDIKRDTHAYLDSVFPPQTIITTNTSILLVSEIEDVLQRGDKFAALHSHLGATLFDIVAGPRTSQGTIDILQRYVVSLNCVPLISQKENPGYIFNAMFGPLLARGLELVIEGIATQEEVDLAWMLSRSSPIGPFGLMDYLGLNVIYDSWARERTEVERPDYPARVLDFLAPFIEQNNLGVKTGKGFYNYPEASYQQPDFYIPQQDLTTIDRVYNALICELILAAILIAQKQVATAEVIDQAWRVATSLDKGPFAILHEMGSATFMARLQSLSEQGFCDAATVALAQDYLHANRLLEDTAGPNVPPLNVKL
jgi:enoyl-CoA hydratase/3-hydroxyacyl-CoA dehydrogenase